MPTHDQVDAYLLENWGGSPISVLDGATHEAFGAALAGTHRALDEIRVALGVGTAQYYGPTCKLLDVRGNELPKAFTGFITIVDSDDREYREYYQTQ